MDFFPCPFMCVAVAYGTISEFHATLSPLMGKCLRSEKEGRYAFYGAMIAAECLNLEQKNAKNLP